MFWGQNYYTMWTVATMERVQFDHCVRTTKALRSSFSFFIWRTRVRPRPKWPNKQNATRTNNSAHLICSEPIIGKYVRCCCCCCCTLWLIEKYKVFCELLYLHEIHAVQRNLLIFDNNQKNVSHVARCPAFIQCFSPSRDHTVDLWRFKLFQWKFLHFN